MAKDASRPRKAADMPDIPDGKCPHIHFKGDVIDRNVLTRKQHLNVLCTPKGYRWVIEASEEPRTKKTTKKEKKEQPGISYVHNFLAEIWEVLTPGMVKKLKEMLINEFGMTDEESVKFICEKRAKTLEVAAYVKSLPMNTRKKSEAAPAKDPEPVDEKLPRFIFNPTLCDRSEFSVGVDVAHVKEFSRQLSNKLAQYVETMMDVKRDGRHKRIAEVILKNLCNLTGEKCSMDDPKNRFQKILTFTADRLALWLAQNLVDEQKKREDQREREDKAIRDKAPEDKAAEAERKKEERERIAKLLEDQKKRKKEREKKEAEKRQKEKDKKKEERDKQRSERQAEIEKQKANREKREKKEEEEKKAQEQKKKEEKEAERAKRAEELEKQNERRKEREKKEQEKKEEEERKKKEQKLKERAEREKVLEEQKKRKEREEKNKKGGGKKEDDAKKDGDDPAGGGGGGEGNGGDEAGDEGEDEEGEPEEGEEEDGGGPVVGPAYSPGTGPGEGDTSKTETLGGEGSGTRTPRERVLDAVSAEMMATEPVETPRQKDLEKVISTRLEEQLGDQDPEINALVREVSSRMATWIDQKVKGIEEDHGVKEIKPSKPAFAVKKLDDLYKIRRPTQQEADQSVREARGLPRRVAVPNARKPMTADDTKAWAQWAQNASKLADDWGKWIDQTVRDADEKAKTLSLQGNELQGKAEWSAFKNKTQSEGLEWRRNMKVLEEVAKMWNQKTEIK